MNLTELLKTDANINLTITLNDLRTITNELIQATKDELENAIHEEKAETYPTRNEVCEILNVNQSTLWRWKNRGYLMPIEVGGKHLYKMSDVKRILNRGE